MISLLKPSPEAIRRYLKGQRRRALSYQEVGATAGDPPLGYTVDHTRVLLGHGERTFLAARAALARWGQFDLGWLDVLPHDTPLVAGEDVAVVARFAGLWWKNSCRIVYVVDEEIGEPTAGPGPVRRFGFAYGTPTGHTAHGEERFLVEWLPGQGEAAPSEQGEVWYDILAYSRPQWLSARAFYFILREIQRRFGPQSAAAMQAATR